MGRSLQGLKASLVYVGNVTLSQGKGYDLLVPRYPRPALFRL